MTKQPSRLALWTALWMLTAWLASGGCAQTRAAGAPQLEFSALDVEGRAHLAAAPGARATVWIFVAHDCPICNAYAPLLARLAADYGPRGVRWQLVYSEPGLSLPELRAHALAYGFTFPLFFDPDLRLAGACGITTTPEAAIFDAGSRLVYRGRIDDLYPEIGHQRLRAQTQDLRDALDQVLNGMAVALPRTTAIGCALETPPNGAQVHPIP